MKKMKRNVGDAIVWSNNIFLAITFALVPIRNLSNIQYQAWLIGPPINPIVNILPTKQKQFNGHIISGNTSAEGHWNGNIVHGDGAGRADGQVAFHHQLWCPLVHTNSHWKFGWGCLQPDRDMLRPRVHGQIKKRKWFIWIFLLMFRNLCLNASI